jgi:DNA-binding NtrC family response regulator
LLSGNSLQIKELNETIKQVAPTRISVLITGESGTGKEIVANAIHSLSTRKHKPLIKVNCGAIPEGIIESELFGHQKGSFTGAIDDRKGYFEMANGGTVFLDEIGDMPLSTQVKLLRVLETGEFMRVGGNQNIKVDVRVIAATNKDLAAEVNNNNFREDLYYRLKSINLNIPPLRERKSDIKILFDFFVDSFCKDNNITFKGISEEALDYLTFYDWKGNARELKNFCESIIVLNSSRQITLDDVKKHLNQNEDVPNRLPAISTRFRKDKIEIDNDFLFKALYELKTDIFELKNLIQEQKTIKPDVDLISSDDFHITKEKIRDMNYDEIEKEIINYLLAVNNWNIKSVAGKLGQTTRNIYNKIKKYNLSK